MALLGLGINEWHGDNHEAKIAIEIAIESDKHKHCILGHANDHQCFNRS